MPCVYLPGPAPAVTVANSYVVRLVNYNSVIKASACINHVSLAAMQNVYNS
jgi:hypothetical protein